MQTSVPIAEAINISKSLGGRRIFGNLCIDIHAGERIALLGANGAGKSTLLRVLASSTRPEAGSTCWFGRQTSELEKRRRIGYLSHETRLYPNLTAHENLLFAARMCAVPEARRQVRWWLESCGLWAYRLRLPAQLSRGMRQRLAIARVLIHEPELILLDEPFSSLDSEGVHWLVNLLISPSYCERGVLFVTHDLAHVERLATRVLRLQSGCLYDAAFSDQNSSSMVTSPPLAA